MPKKATQATAAGRPTRAQNKAQPSEPLDVREQDIRTRAYHRYLERGGGDGWDFDDWLTAERELKSVP